VIVDNWAVHKRQKTKEWVARQAADDHALTPAYTSWLNQVEIWFNIFARDVLRDGV